MTSQDIVWNTCTFDKQPYHYLSGDNATWIICIAVLALTAIAIALIVALVPNRTDIERYRLYLAEPDGDESA